jgi:hypothetical protein
MTLSGGCGAQEIPLVPTDGDPVALSVSVENVILKRATSCKKVHTDGHTD